MTEGLFDMPPGPKGRVEEGTEQAVAAGHANGILVAEDAGMVQAALLAARTLDRCEKLPDKSAVYAVAQNMRPYQDAMNSLRLPAALTPATPPAPAAADGHTSTPDWLRDAFGTAE